MPIPASSARQVASGGTGASLLRAEVGLSCCVLVVALFLYKQLRARAQARRWAQVARRRCDHRAALSDTALACFEGTMTLTAAQERYICRLPAHAIAAGVPWSGSTLPAEAVLAVFARRAQSVGLHVLNCTTETIFEQAYRQAKALDDKTSTTTTNNSGAILPAATATRRPLRLIAKRRKKSSTPAVEAPSSSSTSPFPSSPAAAPSIERPPPPPSLSSPVVAAAAAPTMRRPLEGVPISVKENYIVKGTDATCGMASRCFQPSEEDGLLVQLLKEAGAIPYVKTNVPQALISFETTNNIYGTSLNAWNKLRTPGGSTGGEGGLLAARASPLGVGTDIGGSIRIPCHFSGLFGFKPTTNRVSKKGMTAPRVRNENGQSLVSSVAGPMGRSVKDLTLVLRAWWDSDRMFLADPYVTPQKFNHQVYAQGRGEGVPLRVGLVRSDGHFNTCVTVQRALTMAAEGLESQGHVVVPTQLPLDGTEIVRLYYQIMGADGSLHFMRQALEGEALAGMYQELNRLSAISDWVRALFVAWMKHVMGEHRVATVAGGVRQYGLDVRGFFELTNTLRRVQQMYVNFMQEQQLDALLMPVAPLPAMTHGKSTRLMLAASFTFLPNLLHWPAGACPITTVREDEQSYDLTSLPPYQRDSLSRLAASEMEGTAGLPIGVQLVTMHGEDELCLHLMEGLEKSVPFKDVPQAFEGVGAEGGNEGGR